MEDGVWDCRGIRFVGFKDEEEAFVVGCDKSGKGRDFLKGLVVFDVGELERSDERGKTFGAES